MDRSSRASVAAFFADDPFAPGSTAQLGEDAAQHARVLRLLPGAEVELRNGAGIGGSGSIARVTKRGISIDITRTWEMPRPAEVHMLCPVADKDRVLWLAEKCTELALTSWRPVVWRRSRSVAERSDGVSFNGRLRGRMIAALLQSRGGWLPDRHPSAPLERAILAVPEGVKLLLDTHRGDDKWSLQNLVDVQLSQPLTLALGPEGGFEEEERTALMDAGFTRVSLGEQVLRFETAGIAALAIVRARLYGHWGAGPSKGEPA